MERGAQGNGATGMTVIEQNSAHALSRRGMLKAGLIAAAAGTSTTLAATTSSTDTGSMDTAFPARRAFGKIGTYLNAAATHPIPLRSAQAGMRMLASRADRSGPQPARPDLRPLFASLINASPDEIALVPSTGIAESMVADALGLGPGRGVVTDGLHFDGALAMYASRAGKGMPLAIVRPRDGRVSTADIDAAITPETRLVAVSEISNFNGFRHDLRAICEMAHARGVLVFADVIQAVGAVALDVRSTGVDFCAASAYKWMMGDLGTAFLYVRKDVQSRLTRPIAGWNELDDIAVLGQQTPFDAAITTDRFDFRGGAAGLFETSQQSIVNTAIVDASLALINGLGLDRMAAHRDRLRAHARERLAAVPGVVPITPDGLSTTIEAFAIKGAAARLSGAFEQAHIHAGLYANRLRLSPSVYNSQDDIDRLADIARRTLMT